MKKLLLIAIVSFLTLPGFGQTATNFTCNDCDGVSHDLFSELDAGKVIVLDWVMPCGACVGPSLTTYNVVQSYQGSHPGRVFFYMVDDYANTICPTLSGWATSSGIPANSFSKRFVNAAINMLDYGSVGMPKIVVLGGTSHTVFYNANNVVNAPALQAAIDAALSSTGINENNLISNISVSPNPAAGHSEIKFSLPNATDVRIELYNLLGKKVQTVHSGKMQAGDHKIEVNTSKLSQGTYLVKFNSDGKNKYVNLVITH